MPEKEEQEFAEKLRTNRQNGMGRVKSIKKAVVGDLDLRKYVEVEDFLFVGIALAIALLKDISDFVGIGSLPLIGTIFTLMATGCIWAAMYLAGSRGQKDSKLFFKKVLAYASGMGIELIFGLNFVPAETYMVFFLYILLLQERSYAK